ncbi:HupE/UreJ family protein [Litorivita sp. NS0012-18]|uniref:HupE/UreJ family protein n=1 Tax=Litorivita sp. NS0012-18 TaxID=3127655 RepID=UPI0033417C05
MNIFRKLAGLCAKSRGIIASAVFVIAALAGGGGAQAHEVSPSIADFEVQAGVLQMQLRINPEALLAGIDLDQVSDTNEAPQAEDYDALRALPPEALEQRLKARWPDLAKGVVVLIDGAAAPLSLEEISIEDPGSAEVARAATLQLTGDVPPRAEAVQLSWGAGYGRLILRQNGVEAAYTGTLGGGQISDAIALGGGSAIGAWAAFGQYIPVGFEHILPLGLDHILFVLGLFFLSTHLRPLLWQVSAFTLAHTVTLAMGAMGWVTVPGSIVEPLIAASIVYVALENVFLGHLTRFRPVVIFGFGLLHGLGFASVLGEFGLPEGQFVPALIGFNVGVELGQLTVIALAFLAVGAWFRKKPWYQARIATPASLVIAAIGAYWFVERVFF